MAALDSRFHTRQRRKLRNTRGETTTLHFGDLSYPGVDEHADTALDQGRDVGGVRHHPVRLGGRRGAVTHVPCEPSINNITEMTPG
jgi:hypothetical protein